MPGKVFYNRHSVAASNPGFSDIKCNGCNKVKKVTAFAKNRIPDLQSAASKRVSFNAAQTAVITCMQCNQRSVTELTCYLCDETKALGRFPKTQRRTPDEAMCWTCKEDRANFEPGAEDSDASSGGNSDSDESDDELRLDSVVEETASMSLNGCGGGAATYSSRSTGGVQVDGSTLANTSTRASSTVGTSVTASTSRALPATFDRNANGKPIKKGASSVVSSNGNADSKKFARVKSATPGRYRTIYNVAQAEREEKDLKDKEGDFQVSSDSDE